MDNTKPKTDLDKLTYLYLHTDLSIAEICKELNITYKPCKKWLKILNLHRSEEHEKRVFNRRYITRQQNYIKKYNVKNISQLSSIKKKISQSLKETYKTKSHTEIQQMVYKVKNTKLKKYGNPNYNNMEKNKQTKSNKYGDPNYNNMEKNANTRSKNRTSGKSKEEEQLYKQLTENFNSVKRQVPISSTRHLKFDFVVDDFIIELNGQFWHNFRPYDANNPEHIKEYYLLKQSGKNMYKAIAKHWKYDDPSKLSYCIQNNLNLIVIYFDTLPNNILDIIKQYTKGQTIITIHDKNITVQRLSKA